MQLSNGPGVTDRIRSRTIDLVLGDGITGEFRRAVAAGVRGTVLEIGFGSGRNLAFLPDAVTDVLAVDPSDAGWQRASRRIESFGRPVVRIGVDAAHLPRPDSSVDSVLCTWTLCSVRDLSQVLAEIRRVLRPGGQLHFAEHGLSPEPAIATVQHVLQPAWGRLAGGCHLDRDVCAELVAAGWHLVEAHSAYIGRGFLPARPWSWFTTGRASPR